MTPIENMTQNGKKIFKYFSKGFSLTKKITSQEYDELIDQAVFPLYKKALKKTLLDSSECKRKPEMFFAPTSAKKSLGERHFKKGEDNVLRFIPIVVTIMNFTAHELVIYQCLFDPTTEVALNESTWTYFYKEIVSLETKQDSGEGEFLTPTKKMLYKIPVVNLFIKGKHKQFNVSQEFILTTRGSSKYKVRLSDFEILDEIGGEFETSDVEKTIKAIRSALRDKQR
ncbi:hypothetical protein [Tenacibaculum agarivorans]|uniref:hypothetical protein n=1 Tax=Tenacibaculum agarivorans TaxID=1908389 RepID=UPI00094B7AD5|nr:hypothetical protein [Tenacibaculum agarivorans]